MEPQSETRIQNPKSWYWLFFWSNQPWWSRSHQIREHRSRLLMCQPRFRVRKKVGHTWHSFGLNDTSNTFMQPFIAKNIEKGWTRRSKLQQNASRCEDSSRCHREFEIKGRVRQVLLGKPRMREDAETSAHSTESPGVRLTPRQNLEEIH